MTALRAVVRFAAFLAGALFLVAFRAGARFLVALRAGARLAVRLAGARFLVALRAGARLAAFFAGVRFFAAFRAGARFTDFRAGARLTAFLAVVRLAAFFAGRPLLRGLLGRGPSFCGYCHRCTSLGALSLNRGEACASPRPTAPRRTHNRTGFTCNCVDRRNCVSVMNAATSRLTDLLPEPCGRVAKVPRRTEHAQNEADRFRFPRRTPLCRSTCHYPPSHFGYIHSRVVHMPGQAFFICATHFALVRDLCFALIRACERAASSTCAVPPTRCCRDIE